MWNLLPEQERREWDNKAREEEKRYIQELRDRPDGASAEGEEAAGVSQAGDESDEEERNLLALQLPFGAHSSRGRTAVKRLLTLEAAQRPCASAAKQLLSDSYSLGDA